MKLQLYYPITPYLVTQKFGEIANLAYYQSHGITFKGHNGMDLYAKHGQPIYAAHDGTAYYEIDGSQGHGVVLRTNEPVEFADGTTAYAKTIYWHMCDSTKEPQYRSPIEPFISLNGPGIQVKAGDLLGYADTTGLSTGDHLHFGLKPVMPGEQAGIWYNTEQDNGYMGAIDPTPFFNGLFASEINNPAKFVFTRNIYIGDDDAQTGFRDVTELQKVLIKGGLLQIAAPTGYYGNLTKAAVYAFQKQYVAKDFWSRLQVSLNMGDSVRSLTKAALNAL